MYITGNIFERSLVIKKSIYEVYIDEFRNDMNNLVLRKKSEYEYLSESKVIPDRGQLDA